MSRSILKISLILYSVCLFAFNLVALTLVENVVWGIMVILFYTTALLLMCFKGIWRAVGFWWGAFLVIQSLAYDVLVPEVITLSPNTNKMLYVEGIDGFSGTKRVTTDEKGFRTTKTIDYEDGTTVRVFALGASTTEQALLGDTETWTHLLQENLTAQLKQEVEVINIGVAGLRAEQILRNLRAVSGYHPDLFIILPGINDWNHHVRSEFGALPKWPRLNFVNSPVAYYLRLVWHRAVSSTSQKEITPNPLVEWTLNQIAEAKERSLASFHPTRVQDLYEETMRDIALECRTIKTPCLFLTQPTLYSTSMSVRQQATLWMTPPNANFRLDLNSLQHIAALYNEWLIEFACLERMPFFDLAAHVPKSEEYMYDDVHFTEHGAKKVAQALSLPVKGILMGSEPLRCLRPVSDGSGAVRPTGHIAMQNDLMLKGTCHSHRCVGQSAAASAR
jgi:lysophospholipase L1-like esterase